MHHSTHHTTHHGHGHRKPKASYSRTFLFTIIALALGFGAFSVGVKGQAGLVSQVNPAGAVGADLVVTLRQLNAITLNRDIFQNPVFLNLQDFGLEVVPEPYQRTNPFAPIGLE